MAVDAWFSNDDVQLSKLRSVKRKLICEWIMKHAEGDILVYLHVLS
jgi:hypothetical protein